MPKHLKQELRQDMRRVLSNLDRRWVEVASRELCRNLSQLVSKLSDPPVEHILAWVQFFPGEADLAPFIYENLEHRSVYLPQIRDMNMHFISIQRDWGETISVGEFGIPEPHGNGGRVFDSANAANTVVLVPGLAFDGHGHRLGRGKGHYDTFLARSKMLSAVKIGVCWSLQLLPELSTESHDVDMDWICTEKEIVKVS